MKKSSIKTLIFLALTLTFLNACSINQNQNNKQKNIYHATCNNISEPEIKQLFERWNNSLKNNAASVVKNYAKESILLPTMSNKIRLTETEKTDYFKHFLQKHPNANIEYRKIFIGCNMAIDTGIYVFTLKNTYKKLRCRYTFTYEFINNQWLITSHHSSMMPEQ